MSTFPRISKQFFSGCVVCCFRNNYLCCGIYHFAQHVSVDYRLEMARLSCWRPVAAVGCVPRPRVSRPNSPKMGGTVSGKAPQRRRGICRIVEFRTPRGDIGPEIFRSTDTNGADLAESDPSQMWGARRCLIGVVGDLFSGPNRGRGPPNIG